MEDGKAAETAGLNRTRAVLPGGRGFVMRLLRACFQNKHGRQNGLTLALTPALSKVKPETTKMVCTNGHIAENSHS